MNDQIATRTFRPDDQQRFAHLSGDANPMHLDAIAARRTLAGASVVHGMHTVLWSLENLAAQGRIGFVPVDLDVQFKKFLYVDDEAQLIINARTESSLRCSVVARGIPVTTIALTRPSPNVIPSEVEGQPPSGRSLDFARDDTEPTNSGACEPQPIPPVARDMTLELLADDSGCIALGSATEAAAMFPAATERFGAETITCLAHLSGLVGMVCPGLHSIFGGLRIAVDRAQANGGLKYRVESVDSRFRRIEMVVDGPGVAGRVSTFMRHPPVPQPALRDVRPHVAPDEFAATTALIIGGSRGLGALTARILAAGGARVVVTYNVGLQEAQELAAEIGDSHARIMHYNVLAEATSQLVALPWDVNQLYYFATAQIFRSGDGSYSASRYNEFSAIYVDGFARLYAALRARSSAPISIFYPSSIFVEERPREMAEYAMAKAAGETLCADLSASTPGVRIITPRLPRLATDQTATLLPTRSADPIAELLPHIRSMHPH